MKKNVRNSIIVGVATLVVLILCAIPILVNRSKTQVNKLAKLEEPETKQESTVGTESDLSGFKYTTNNTDNTITLKSYSGTDISLTIYSKYLIDDNVYNTVILNEYAAKYEPFIYSSTLQTVTFQDEIIWRGSAQNFFMDCVNLKSVDFGGVINYGNITMYGMFRGCKKLQTVSFANANFTNITDMATMFYECTSLKNVDLKGINTSIVTNMSNMFYKCGALTGIDLSSLDTSSVEYTRDMFRECSSLESLDLSNWDTSSMTTMYEMFRGCTLLEKLNLSNWNTSNVTDMYGIFNGCVSLESLDLSNWNTYNVTSMNYMFTDCDFSVLITPKIGNTNIVLPYTMYDDKGAEYTKLPSKSMTLYKEIPAKKYTVTFVNEGTTISTQTVEEGNAATVPSPAPTKTGYTLSWDKDFSNVTSDLTVEAVWTPNTYTVTLNKNGATVNAGDITSYTYGIGATLPTNVTKEGYVFRGWYANEGLEGNAVTSISTEETGNKTYYAKLLVDTDGDGIPDIEDDDTQVAYTVEHYKQNLSQNGYEKVEEDTVRTTGHLGSTVSATPKTYTGFTLTQTNNTVSSGTVVVDGSLTLKLYYNRNRYKLPLNVDGEIEEIEYVYGEEITLPTDKEKEGYTFEGWYNNEDLNGQPIEKVDTNKIDPENPPTYYIKWTANSGTPYTVKHYKQQGNTNEYILADTERLTGATGETITAKPKTYEGYVENLTANERVPSGVIKGDGSLELVLLYDTIKCTVIFINEGTIAKTETVLYGEAATAPELTKSGYVLRWDKEFSNVKDNIEVNARWLKDTDGDGIPDIEDDDTQVPYKVEHYTQNTDLETYTLRETVDKVEGTNTPLTGNLGHEVNATPKTYTGFTLATTNDTKLSGIVVDDGSLTLKLFYNRNNYAVTLNKNEGTIVEGNVINYIYGIGATLPTNVIKEGYVFRGWFEQNDFSGNVVTAIGTEETGAKIYYAKWLVDTDRDGIPDIEDDDTQVAYTVEYYKQNLSQNGYEKVEEDTIKTTGHLGSTVNAEPKTYTGFTLTQTNDTVSSGEVVVDGSLTLKLYYNRETYNITYETNGGRINDENYVTEYTYGIVVNLPSDVTKTGYTFGGWYENIVEDSSRAYTRSVEETKTIVSQTKETDTGAKTYYANWIAKGDTSYKVEHYKQTENGYILEDTDNLTAATDAQVTAIPKTYEGYVENTKHEERIANGTVLGDGSLSLKLYYDKITYKVIFKDGEETAKTEIVVYGTGATAPNLTKQGYILRWDKEFDNVISDITVNAVWLRDTDGDGIPDIEDPETLVEYIVRHYKQQGNTNTYTLADTETLKGQLGTVVTATPKQYEGYVENVNVIERIPSGELTSEGNLELRLFYNTIKYEIIFKDGDEEIERQEVPHGGTAKPPVLTKPGYTLTWDKNLNNITEEQTINAVWTKVEETQKIYKVEHYVETKEGTYILKETETLVGDIGEAVTAKAKTYEEYILNETHKDTIKTGKIEENKELVLKLYYNYKRFTIIFKDGDEEVGRQEVIYGGTAKPPVLTKPGYILSWDKNINNITGEQTLVAVWTVDPNYKDPNAGQDDNNTTINKLPNDGKEEQRPSILPKTGEETVTILVAMWLLGIGVIYFVKYKF